MAALLAKALALAVIVSGPGPFPCGQSATQVRDGCAVAPNQVYLPTGYWGWVGNDERWFAYDGSERLNMRNHELGHIVDYNLLTNSDRGMFQALIHRRGPWHQRLKSPHEQFAEAFRLCSISTRYVSRHGGFGYGYEPTLLQHRKVCRWLATVGQRP